MDREKVINELNTDVLPFLQHHCDMQCDREKRWISKMIITVHDALALLKEQEAEIRQLRLALDIAKGACKGIAFETDEKFMGDL